jgi:hypothetical protein
MTTSTGNRKADAAKAKAMKEIANSMEEIIRRSEKDPIAQAIKAQKEAKAFADAQSA